MKPGRTLVEMAKELTRIRESAKDFIVPVRHLTAVVSDNRLALSFQDNPKAGTESAYHLNSHSGSQLAGYSDIPKAYFDRLASENPSLAAHNVNHGLSRIPKSDARMVRSLDGKIRGLLSSRYRILDSYDLLETVLPVAQASGLEVVSSEITERRLFIKLLSSRLKTEIVKGDLVQYGLTISTSDVGAGSVRVEPLIYRLVCANGMIGNTAIRKFHVGKNQAESDVYEILSDRTKELTDAAFWAQVRDVVLASLKPENFERQVDRLREAAKLPIENYDLHEVVELTMRSVGLGGEEKKKSIVAALASGNEGAGLTQWGLINSITRAAQEDQFDYETSIEMERAAGQVLELSKKDWARIAEAA